MSGSRSVRGSIGTRDTQLSKSSSPNWAIMVVERLGMEILLGGDAHIAQFSVKLQRMHAAFAPDTRLLRAAEGCAQIAQEPRIDPDDPGIDAGPEPKRACDIARPNARGQPIGRVIR